MLPDFIGARRAAIQLLLDQRLHSLRLDVTKLSFSQDIRFDSMQNFCAVTRTSMRMLSDGSDCLRDGATLIIPKNGRVIHLVLYNDEKQNQGRRAFTLAHEVGHICLGHDNDGDRQEQEANCFASELLAPGPLVLELMRRSTKPLYPEDLCEVFALSGEAAANRLQQMTRMRRSAFNRQEHLLLERFGFMLPKDRGAIVDF